MKQTNQTHQFKIQIQIKRIKRLQKDALPYTVTTIALHRGVVIVLSRFTISYSQRLLNIRLE